MKLVSVYDEPRADEILWILLAERPPEANISHREMPTIENHLAFIASRPYAHWYLVQVGEEYVGSVYLTKTRKVGIGILRGYQGRGYGPLAVKLIKKIHPGRMLANIAPKNIKSIEMFTKLGYKMIQATYAKD